MDEFIKNSHMLEQAMLTNVTSSLKTHQVEDPNGGSLLTASIEDSFRSPYSTLVKKITTGGNEEHEELNDLAPTFAGGSPKLQEIKGNDVKQEFFTIYDSYRRQQHALFGRRINDSQKRERLVTNEQENNIASFPVLERETGKNLLAGVEELNAKFGMDVKLYCFVPESGGGTDATDKITKGDNPDGYATPELTASQNE